jgi:hypothetical protein
VKRITILQNTTGRNRDSSKLEENHDSLKRNGQARLWEANLNTP